MLKKTHLRIAQNIAKELDLTEKAKKLLCHGSLSPDDWANFPHHHGKDEQIILNILEAQKLFVSDDDECYHKLGVTLHYIQDRWTLKPRLATAHTKWEQEIDKAKYLNNREIESQIAQSVLPSKAEKAYSQFFKELENGIEKNENPVVDSPAVQKMTYPSYPSGYSVKLSDEVYKFIEEEGLKVIAFALEERPSTWSTPVIDYNIAYRLSLEVAKQILSNKENGKWFDEESLKTDNERRSREFWEEQERINRKRKELNPLSWVIIIGGVAFLLFMIGMIIYLALDMW